jgi:hypothetical protein
MRLLNLIFEYFMGFLMPRLIGVVFCALGGGALGGIAWAILHEADLVGKDAMWFFAAASVPATVGSRPVPDPICEWEQGRRTSAVSPSHPTR